MLQYNGVITETNMPAGLEKIRKTVEKKEIKSGMSPKDARSKAYAIATAKYKEKQNG